MIKNLLLMFSLVLYSAIASAALYKWVDDKGNTHYTSTPPPESAVHDREVIGKQGRVIKTLQGKMTAEEKAAYEQKMLEEEQAARAREEQEKNDRSLLISYTSLSDIEENREAKLKTLDEYIESLELVRNRSGEEYDELLSQAITEEREGKVPSEKLKADMRSAKREFDEAEADLANARIERKELEKRFIDDISRFKELKGIK
jgi:predicted RNA-binding protein YlqC (UPF0109 family)